MPDDSQDKTRTAGGGNDSGNNDSAPMKRLGDFELLREIGRGGMGIVYEARQVSLNRRVALKVLPPGLGLTGQAVQRFEREAQAAAKLHHTNIVPVHAIGEEEGCHYYAMELVEGQALSEVLRDLTGSGSNPLMDATVTMFGGAEEKDGSAPDPTVSSPSLGASGITSLSDTSSGSRKWFDVVAKLISEVADALEYAHGRGVIHRDIKPANLMLSREGKLCVTDFGLARVAQEPGMTVSGSLMGTPAYMSPEQITAGRVKLDHRTDVYSLGAVLYEMLAHRRPFPGESREEILTGILTKDPRPPRRFNPRIPVDLETICQKAMEKDPDKRYATAGEFAEDLRRFLAHGLIQARRAGIAKRTWKSIRRHPVTATVTVGVILLALLGTFAQQLWVSHSEESAARLVAAAEVDLREGTYRQGLEKIDRALAIAPEMPAVIKTRGRLLFEDNSEIRVAIRVARKILAENPDDWEAHGWLVYQGVMEDMADVDVDAHVAALERLAPDTARAWYVRGVSAASAAERIRYLDRALDLEPGHVFALYQRASAKMELHQTASAIVDAERVIAVRPRSTRGHRLLAGIYLRDLRDFDRALEEFDKAAAIDPDDYKVYYHRSAVYQRGNLDDREKRLEELTRALELAPVNYVMLAGRAHALNSMSRFEEALADSRNAVKIEPHDPTSWSPLLWSLWKLERLDELREAMDEFRRLAEGWPNQRSAAKAYRQLAVYYRSFGEHDEAVKAAERAIELDPRYVDGYTQLIHARHAQAGEGAIAADCDRLQTLDLSEPGPLKERAVQLRDVCLRPEAALVDLDRAIEVAPQWAGAYSARGKLNFIRSEYTAAIADWDRAIECAPQWARPYRWRGVCLVEKKRYEEALASITRAIELSPRDPNALYDRAQLNIHLERFEEALVDLDLSIKLVGGAQAPWANGRWKRAIALLRLGRDDEALAAVDQAIENNPRSIFVIRRRVYLLWWMGRIEEAMEAAERAVEHSPKNGSTYLTRAQTLLFEDGHCDRAVADLARAQELAPDSSTIAGGWSEPFSTIGGIAWVHAALMYRQCPAQFDGQLALDLANKGVEGSPGNVAGNNSLGMTLYRLDRFREARQALLRATELRSPKPEPPELFVLAMTEWKLGNRDEARSYHERAVARMNETYPRYPGYIMLKEEAAEVVGIKD